MGTEGILLAESRWHHCDDDLLLMIATSDVAERPPSLLLLGF